jgi:putative heme-binding domain-containing protein
MIARFCLRLVACCLVWSCFGGSVMPATLAEEAASAVKPLMQLFQSGRLPPERQPTVVEMICKRGNEHDLRVIFDRIIQPEGFPPETRLKAVQWLHDASTTRKVKPTGDLAAIGELVVGPAATESPALRQAAIQLASSWNDASIAPVLRQLATNQDVDAKLKQVAIAGLVSLGDPDSRATLESLASPGHSIAVRMQAVAGLTAFDLDVAATASAKLLVDVAPEDDPAVMLDAFFRRKEGSDRLAAAIGKVNLAQDVAKHALRYMYSVGRSDAALSDVLGKAAGIDTDAPPPTPEELAAIVADVAVKGDPARGEAIFRRKDLNCMKCHSVSRAGGQIGPELSAVGGSSPVDYVVNSILNPNLAVKEQFVTRLFFLQDGTTVTGIVVDRDDVRVLVRDARGEVLTVPVADIEEEAEGQSLMPQGLTRFLTRDELLDLARFVSELGKPGAYAVQTDKTIQRWRVLRSPAKELVDDVPHLENVRQLILGSDPADWDAAYGKVNGYLPLSEVKSNPAMEVLILQGEIAVSTGGTVAIQIESTETYQIWLDDQPLNPDNTITAALEAGPHKLTLRVELSQAETPEADNAQLRVELTPPPDSTLEFEVVGGN